MKHYTPEQCARYCELRSIILDNQTPKNIKYKLLYLLEFGHCFFEESDNYIHTMNRVTTSYIECLRALGFSTYYDFNEYGTWGYYVEG